MKKTLVIIDMQRGFGCSNALITINRVIKQIKLAKQNEDFIVIVEYNPNEFKATRVEIMNAIGDYPHIKVYKDKCDGSEEIIAACKKHGYSISIFRICGVSTSVCVFQTIRGLYEELQNKTKLEVVANACNGHGIDNYFFDKFVLKYKAKIVGTRLKQAPIKYI